MPQELFEKATKTSTPPSSQENPKKTTSNFSSGVVESQAQRETCAFKGKLKEPATTRTKGEPMPGRHHKATEHAVDLTPDILSQLSLKSFLKDHAKATVVDITAFVPTWSQWAEIRCVIVDRQVIEAYADDSRIESKRRSPASLIESIILNAISWQVSGIEKNIPLASYPQGKSDKTGPDIDTISVDIESEGLKSTHIVFREKMRNKNYRENDMCVALTP